MTQRTSVASSCDDALVSDLEAWDRRTAERLERDCLAAGAGHGGSGSSETSEGAWRAKRQRLCVPMHLARRWLRQRTPRPLVDDLSDAGYPPGGQIRIDRPRRHLLLSSWIDA
jgi:hypothetical protein